MSQLLYPYPVINGELLSEVDIQGAHRDLDSRTISLYRPQDPSATIVSVNIKVSVATSDISEMQRVHNNVCMTAVIRCRITDVRQAVVLRSNDMEVWTGEFELDRRQYSGEVSVQTLLTGIVAGRRRRWLGAGPEWKILLGEPRSFKHRGEIPVKWEDFGNLPAVAGFADEPFYVDLDSGPLPLVYLNTRIKDLPRILPTEGQPHKSLRPLYEVTRTSIARTTWMGLLQTAIAGIERLSEEDKIEPPSPPSTPWQEEILRRLLPEIYPDATFEECLRRAARSLEDQADARLLESRAVLVIERDVLRDGTSLRRALRGVDEYLSDGGEN